MNKLNQIYEMRSTDGFRDYLSDCDIPYFSDWWWDNDTWMEEFKWIEEKYNQYLKGE